MWEIIKTAAKNHKHSENLSVKEAPHLYKFGEEFAKELVKADISEIPISQLPKKWHGCCKLINVYYFIFFDRGEHFTSDGRRGEAGFAVFTALPDEERYDYFVTPLGGDFGTTVGDALRVMKEKLVEVKHNEYDVLFKRAVASFVYVSTGSPDLREYKPPTRESHPLRKDRDRQIQQFGNESCTLVSWGWLKPRATHTVQGHFWWAPVGEKKKERELRWRNGHVRGEKTQHSESTLQER